MNTTETKNVIFREKKKNTSKQKRFVNEANLSKPDCAVHLAVPVASLCLVVLRSLPFQALLAWPLIFSLSLRYLAAWIGIPEVDLRDRFFPPRIAPTASLFLPPQEEKKNYFKIYNLRWFSRPTTLNRKSAISIVACLLKI